MGIETLAIASLGASIAGAGISAMGQMQSGEASMAAAQYRAQVGRNMADAALAQGGAMVQRQGFKTGQALGTQRAGFGAAGVDVNKGTPVDVAQSTAQVGKLDSETLMHNAILKSMGLQEEANLTLAEGQQKKTASRYAAMESVLGGVSSVGDKWLGFKAAGIV